MMDNNIFSNEEAKKVIIGLARDLRGLALPLNARIQYTMLFEWLYYADYLPILLRAMDLWAHDPAVTTPILKLFAELVHCRTQRLAGNVSSPMGILLFREASKLICIYGNRILHQEVPRERLYPMRLKGIAICFLILKNSLGGNYVNCGVFKLYGDDTLDSVLNIIAKLILTIEQRDLIVSNYFSIKWFICFKTICICIIAGISQIINSLLQLTKLFIARSCFLFGCIGASRIRLHFEKSYQRTGRIRCVHSKR